MLCFETQTIYGPIPLSPYPSGDMWGKLIGDMVDIVPKYFMDLYGVFIKY